MRSYFARVLLACVALAIVVSARAIAPGEWVRGCLQETKASGGLCVIVNDARRQGPFLAEVMREIGKSEAWTVHALDTDPVVVAGARAELAGGRLSVETWSDRAHLPYADGIVTLLIADNFTSRAEVERVLAPGGVGIVRFDQGGVYTSVNKPQLAGADTWTHHNHGPDGNPASTDTAWKMSDSLRWFGGIPMGWGLFATRTAGGRNFYFTDPTNGYKAHLGGTMEIICRDAYSGVTLWKQNYPWSDVRTHQRPVVTEDRVFILSKDRVLALDAATGKEAKAYAESGAPYDFLVSDGVLLCRDDASVRALDVKTGELLWKHAAGDDPAKMKELYGQWGVFAPGWRPQVLVLGDGAVYYADGKTIIGRDVRTGEETLRRSDARMGNLPHPRFFHDGFLYLTSDAGFVGMSATKDGPIWAVHPLKPVDPDPNKPVDPKKPAPKPQPFDVDGAGGVGAFLATDGMVWIRHKGGISIGDFTPGEPGKRSAKGWVGLDPKTGAVRKYIEYPTSVGWSNRCYDDIAVPGAIISETAEFVDLGTGTFAAVRGVRGQCGIGFMVGNGMLYTPPNSCIFCYPMIRGAAAYASDVQPAPVVPDEQRLERGPAFGAVKGPAPAAFDEWPLYRANALRTGCTSAAVEGMRPLWTAKLADRATAPVIAGGLAVVAEINRHRVVALDAATGKERWSFVAGGRIDTAPTLAGDLCLFGCHDGYVYALRAADGALVWRFLAAPASRRIIAEDQVVSTWPVMGSVLVHDGVVYAMAGLLSRLDGGLHLYALDATTGQMRWRRNLRGIVGEKAGILPTHWYIHEEHMLNNLLFVKGEELRIFDQHGGWEFSTKDGTLTGQSAGVPQPGWPKGRLTPGDPAAADRWPWCGWDRVTINLMLRGMDGYCIDDIGMDPRTRASDRLRGHRWLFPAAKGWGLHMDGLRRTGPKLEPAPWDDPTLAKTKLPWEPVDVPKDIRVFIQAGPTAYYAGGDGKLQSIDAATGKPGPSCELGAAPSYDGLAAAQGRLYIALQDGRVVCLGKR